IPLSSDSVPKAVPLMVVRVGNRMIATLPGEGTAEVGVRVRAAVQAAAAGTGVSRVIVSGLANDFIQYFTTPEEYDRQHYEGGSTLYGPLSAPFLSDRLAELSRSIAIGAPAPEAYPFDPTNGVKLDGPEYGSGAAGGRLRRGPRATRRLGHATIDWTGGPDGLDRPLDRAFVRVERRVGRRWRTAATDLGLNMLWTVDGSGLHMARWEIPLSAPRGRYRFVVRAKRYHFASGAFRVLPSRALSLRQVPAGPGRVAVAMQYPAAVRDVDLTFRPQYVNGGVVAFRVGAHTTRIGRSVGKVFRISRPAGVSVTVPAGAARDRWGNVNGNALTVR
ncbi:MAG TPA: neutral/alkaline non-lysosomal ceramidase N-terminal domain-containing protein, partial [Solirubrobacteraceae bacterium]|nr:neutral/alkaline non-lysosomal ceramidase N-terminal domain-containing protein [Solirubrobacteraceae bacterium]